MAHPEAQISTFDGGGGFTARAAIPLALYSMQKLTLYIFFKALNKNRYSDESQMISFTQKRNSFGLNNDYTDQGSTGHEERAISQKRVL